MRHIAAILLIFVNLISSGLVEFAIDSCCVEKEISCCPPPIESNSESQLIADGCCCTESESHFYYLTAKFQNTEKQHHSFGFSNTLFEKYDNEISLSELENYNHRAKEISNQYRLRKKVPPSLSVQYGVWLI